MRRSRAISSVSAASWIASSAFSAAIEYRDITEDRLLRHAAFQSLVQEARRALGPTGKHEEKEARRALGPTGKQNENMEPPPDAVCLGRQAAGAS